jgi:hypothetical protein
MDTLQFRRISFLAKSRTLLAKGERSGHPFRGNQYTGGRGGGGNGLPLDPGTAPIPEGHVRLWHYSNIDRAPGDDRPLTELVAERIKSLHENGITMGNSRTNTYGEPQQIWARAGDAVPKNMGDKIYVEFHLDPKQLDIGSQRSPQDLNERQSDVTILHDVKPSDIIAIHEPWHEAARYFRDNPDAMKIAQEGGYDSMLGDKAYALDYDPAIRWAKNQALAKGEAAGHPFRGNQYKAGVSGPHDEVAVHHLAATKPVNPTKHGETDEKFLDTQYRRSKNDAENKRNVVATIGDDIAKKAIADPELGGQIMAHLHEQIVATVVPHAKAMISQEIYLANNPNAPGAAEHRAYLDRLAERAGVSQQDLEEGFFLASHLQSTVSEAIFTPTLAKMSQQLSTELLSGHLDDKSPTMRPDEPQMALSSAIDSVANLLHFNMDSTTLARAVNPKTATDQADEILVGSHLFAQRTVDTWAETSSDNNSTSLALQLAVAKHFGLPEDQTIFNTSAQFEPHGSKELAMKGANAELAKFGKAYDTLVTSIYDRTQAMLKADGIKTVTLFRGTTEREAGPAGTDKTVQLNPLSASSYKGDEAASFASMRAGRLEDQRIIVATIPASRVFSTYLTGPGCTGESEVLLIGGKAKDHVTVYEPLGPKYYSDINSPAPFGGKHTFGGIDWATKDIILKPLATRTPKAVVALDKYIGEGKSNGGTIRDAVNQLREGRLTIKEFEQWAAHKPQIKSLDPNQREDILIDARLSAEGAKGRTSGGKAFFVGSPMALDRHLAMVASSHDVPKLEAAAHKMLGEGTISNEQYRDWTMHLFQTKRLDTQGRIDMINRSKPFLIQGSTKRSGYMSRHALTPGWTKPIQLQSVLEGMNKGKTGSTVTELAPHALKLIKENHIIPKDIEAWAETYGTMAEKYNGTITDLLDQAKKAYDYANPF